MAETTDIKESNDSESINTGTPIIDIVYMTLRRWPWIILSVFVCLALAGLYILCTPKVYTRSAEIMIKDLSKGQTASIEDFAELGFMSSKTNVIDEIFTIQSKDLVAEVVSRLNLDYSYYKSGAFHDLLLYGSNLPIIVSLPDISAEDKLSLNVEVTPEGIVKVSKIKAFDEEFDATVEEIGRAHV